MPPDPPPFADHPHQAAGFDARGPAPLAGQKKSLLAPWRLAYVSRSVEHKGPTCFLCDLAARPAADAENLVLIRGTHCLVCLNRFPYSNGHLLVAPYRHVADLSDLSEAENLELLALAREGCRRLRAVMDAQGFNVGLNLGVAAGAGVPGHLHLHVVPRWAGDTNFMPVVGDVRVIPQALEATYEALRAAEKL